MVPNASSSRNERNLCFENFGWSKFNVLYMYQGGEEGTYVCAYTGIGECAMDAEYRSDRSLRAIPNVQVSLLTKQGRVVITSPICRTFVDEATVGHDVKDWIARVKRVGLPGPGTTQIKSRRRFRLCIIFPSIDGCQCAFALLPAIAVHVRTYVLGPRHIAENIGETINWRRVCVRNETDRQIGYTRAFSRIQERTRSLHIVIKFRIDGCQLVQSFFN